MGQEGTAANDDSALPGLIGMLLRPVPLLLVRTALSHLVGSHGEATAAPPPNGQGSLR